MRRQHSEDLFRNSTMTFGEHLEELRRCLFRALLGLAVGFVFGLLIGAPVVDFIQTPLAKALTKYRKEQMEQRLEELQTAGQIPPGNQERFADLVEEDGLVAREVFIDPAEVVRELRNAEAQPSGRLPVEADTTTPDSQAEPKRLRKGDLIRIFAWQPVERETRTQSLSAHEPFMIYIKASLLVGALAASPWIFYQIWSFVAAGLYPHEKQYVHVFLPFSLGLFLLGAALAFFVVFDFVLDFLLRFNRWLGIAPGIRINDWLGFVLVLPLGFGISFQLPLVMLFLERIGVFDVKSYLSKWRMAVLVIFVLAMFLTPSDPQSMLLMAVPLMFLYFGGILLCRFMPRRRSPFDEIDE